ncbi:DUF1289 domain-containing protein [Neorhodopirellula lusitana]|uniref:DUF1289 domain-containing protein n=1 Tax=Neorhodopirellula lusitana TaxID=445327 RepID=UPI00384E2D92
MIRNTTGSQLVPRSPCTGVCQTDQLDICIGCLRSVSEIGRWSIASNDEKRAILAQIHQRRFAALTKQANLPALDSQST